MKGAGVVLHQLDAVLLCADLSHVEGPRRRECAQKMVSFIASFAPGYGPAGSVVLGVINGLFEFVNNTFGIVAKTLASGKACEYRRFMDYYLPVDYA